MELVRRVVNDYVDITPISCIDFEGMEDMLRGTNPKLIDKWVMERFDATKTARKFVTSSKRYYSFNVFLRNHWVFRTKRFANRNDRLVWQDLHYGELEQSYIDHQSSPWAMWVDGIEQ